MSNAETWPRKADFKNRLLFMAVEDDPPLAETLDRFTAVLRSVAPSGLVWEYQHWPEEDHGTIPHRAVFQGIRFTFARWSRLPDEVVSNGTEAIEKYERQVSQWYGFDIGLSRGGLFGAVRHYLDRGDADEAAAVAALMTRSYPDDAFGHRLLGRAYENGGKLDLALRAYERAYAVAVKNASPHLSAFKESLELLRKRLKGAKERDEPM